MTSSSSRSGHGGGHRRQHPSSTYPTSASWSPVSVMYNGARRSFAELARRRPKRLVQCHRQRQGSAASDPPRRQPPRREPPTMTQNTDSPFYSVPRRRRRPPSKARDRARLLQRHARALPQPPAGRDHTHHSLSPLRNPRRTRRDQCCCRRLAPISRAQIRPARSATRQVKLALPPPRSPSTEHLDLTGVGSRPGGPTRSTSYSGGQ